MLGAALRSALANDAAMVRLVRRAPSAAGELQWTPEAARPMASTEALEGLRAAIHLSGANVAERRWTPAYKRAMYTSRVESTRVLCEMLSALRRPPQTLLVASAVGIYGSRGNEVLDESSAQGAGFLAGLCGAWEEAAQPAIAAGIRVVHLRMGVVIGGSAGALGKMLPVFRMGLGGKLGNGKQWMSWIALPDVVAAVKFILHAPSLAGPVNLVSPHPVTNAEFTQALSRRLRRPALLAVPAFALRLALGQMASEALLASTRVLPGRLLQAGFQFSQPTIDLALRSALA